MAKYTIALDDIQDQALTARAAGGVLSNGAVLQLIVEHSLLEYVQKVRKLEDARIIQIVKSDPIIWDMVKARADVP